MNAAMQRGLGEGLSPGETPGVYMPRGFPAGLCAQSVARTNASHSSLALQDDGADAPYSTLRVVQRLHQEDKRR